MPLPPRVVPDHGRVRTQGHAEESGAEQGDHVGGAFFLGAHSDPVEGLRMETEEPIRRLICEPAELNGIPDHITELAASLECRFQRALCDPKPRLSEIILQPALKPALIGVAVPEDVRAIASNRGQRSEVCEPRIERWAMGIELSQTALDPARGEGGAQLVQEVLSFIPAAVS